MKYYGIKSKNKTEDFTYSYARNIIKLRSVLPGKNRKYFKQNYEFIFEHDHYRRDRNNSIPSGKFLKLDHIVTLDLILREDIGKLQKGIRALLKKHRAGDRFIVLPIESLDEICSRIDRMDSSLLSWYEDCDCGVFDFRGEELQSTIDYFSMRVANINSSYLCVDFRIFLTDSKRKELDEIINMDYHEHRGYAKKMLTSPKNGGAFSSYTVAHYNDDALKADRIFEWISYVEWEFYEAIKKYIPLVLHNNAEMPPRIEVFYTDIDYRDDNDRFWSSIGISAYQGQFIDERQKMFFETGFSGRYEDRISDRRLLYVIKDDGIEIGQLKSVKDTVYFHIEEYAKEYFRFLFLGILSRRTGKEIITFKHKLDKIKLRKNKLKQLLKLRYQFERTIDTFVRYERDDIWEGSKRVLGDEIFSDNMEMLSKMKRPFCITYEMFCDGIVRGSHEIKDSIKILRKEFAEKEDVLQHLSDYRNSAKNFLINIIMLIITAITLLFVIFPERAVWVANIYKTVWQWFIGLF